MKQRGPLEAISIAQEVYKGFLNSLTLWIQHGLSLWRAEGKKLGNLEAPNRKFQKDKLASLWRYSARHSSLRLREKLTGTPPTPASQRGACTSAGSCWVLLRRGRVAGLTAEARLGVGIREACTLISAILLQLLSFTPQRCTPK